MRRLLLIVGALLLAGCGTPAPAPVSSGAQALSSAPIPTPTAVTLPTLGVESTLIPLGLDADGALEVPDVETPEQAGWFADGVNPGEVGPAVIAAHVDGGGRDGLFHDLHELEPGDPIVVDVDGGLPRTFEVTAVETHDKDAFPTAAVYGDTATPQLRLITCGGVFDPGERSYEDNVIAFAVLAS